MFTPVNPCLHQLTVFTPVNSSLHLFTQFYTCSTHVDTCLPMFTQMGVMTWLFGGAVKSLGTEAHMAKWFHPLKVSIALNLI